MARMHMFADEAGNFDFSRKPGASRFFILTTVAFPRGHDALATDLRALRFELAWDGTDLRREFHATEDPQRVRDRVFELLRDHDFRVDATILDKPKARPETRSSDERFYRFAWLFHLRNVLPSLLAADSELLLVAASVGTGNRRRAFWPRSRALFGRRPMRLPESPSGPRPQTPACRLPTTAHGRFSASGNAGMSGHTT